MSSLFAQMADLHANLLTAAAAAAAEDAGAARLIELSTAARDLDHALATWRGQAPAASRAALEAADALRQLSEATARFIREVEHNVETYDDVEVCGAPTLTLTNGHGLWSQRNPNSNSNSNPNPNPNPDPNTQA